MQDLLQPVAQDMDESNDVFWVRLKCSSNICTCEQVQNVVSIVEEGVEDGPVVVLVMRDRGGVETWQLLRAKCESGVGWS